MKRWRQENRDRIRVQKKAWDERNAVHVQEYARERHRGRGRFVVADYRARTKERRAAWAKEYNSRPEVVEARNRQYGSYQNQQYRTNPTYRLAKLLRSRIRAALQNGVKRGSAVKDLGCSLDVLRRHLESGFQPGMSWKNWGLRGWHIDHILPLASFDLTDRQQFLKACHYTNLQPLWAADNMKKGARWSG